MMEYQDGAAFTDEYVYKESSHDKTKSMNLLMASNKGGE